MDNLRSPLRYPGGKNALADYFEVAIKENLLVGSHLYEPYAGGASISLAMLSRKLISKTTLIERDPLIYAFWKCVKFYSEELCDEVNKVRITVETWKQYQKYLDAHCLEKYSIVELGLAGLFLNRTCFSGIITAGPIGGMNQTSEYEIACRFNRERLVELIKQMAMLGPRLSVVFGDALQYLRKNESRIAGDHGLVYVDPPYFRQGHRLYRYSYTEKNHRALADLVTKAKYSWIVSYDNEPFIRRLFSGQKIVPISLNYAVKESRRADELLISNIKLSEPVYHQETASNRVHRRVATS